MGAILGCAFILVDLLFVFAVIILIIWLLGITGVWAAVHGLGNILFILLVIGLLLIVCGGVGRHRHHKGGVVMVA